MEIDFSAEISAQKKKGKAPLNKPFRLPKGSKKKFGVYVKNDKGNIVMVKFGDPNMSIKRDNPERRKAYRSRHGCDNPGPKWKANYWSCKMWSAKPVSKITASCGKPNCGSVNDSEEITLEVMIQAKNKGLWYNIQQKKKRMGKKYRPAKPGSPDRPTEEALKKAQGSEYENENYEWDGGTEFEQSRLLDIDPSLIQVQELEGSYTIKEDYQGCKFAVVDEEGEIDQCFDSKEKAQEYLRLEEQEEKLEESEAKASTMFEVGDKVRNINGSCKHYGSEGIVKEILDLGIRVEGQSKGFLEDVGYAVVYECTNQGMTWKKGDLLGKTEIQLKKIN